MKWVGGRRERVAASAHELAQPSSAAAATAAAAHATDTTAVYTAAEVARVLAP